jgi:hypothetical protein
MGSALKQALYIGGLIGYVAFELGLFALTTAVNTAKKGS